MSVRFTDLMHTQILLLDQLDDGWAHEDSVGRPMRAMSDATLATAFSLIDLELATVSFGWQGAGWVRLSEAGLQIIEEALKA